MALEALWAALIPDVSEVSQVQAPVYAGFSDTPPDLLEVAGVPGVTVNTLSPGMIGEMDTPDTPRESGRYQAQPPWILACTRDTPDTPEKSNTKIELERDQIFDKLLDAAGTTSKPKTRARIATIAVSCPEDQTANDPTESLVSAKVTPMVTGKADVSKGVVRGLVRTNSSDLTDPDNACWSHSRSMTGSEINTLTARKSAFTDRALDVVEAEAMANKLVLRDRERDDRRACLECLHLSGHGTTLMRCGNWQMAGIAIRARDAHLPTDLVLALQRCDGFAEILRNDPSD